MALNQVLPGAEFTDVCDLPGMPAAAAESACRPAALGEYPLWCGTALAGRWFAAPGKLLRMDGRGPYCWLIAAGQARTGLQSIRTAIPGRWQPVPHQDRN
jgi:hypothetical protein